MYLQRNSEQTESTFLSDCLSDEKVALSGKIKMASGTDVSSFLSLPIRHPWDTSTHLEGIVNGIDTVPGLIKNELSCCDVNTKWPEPTCIYLDLLWSHPHPNLSVSTVDLFTFYFVCFSPLQINKICKSIDSWRLSLNTWNRTELIHRLTPGR